MAARQYDGRYWAAGETALHSNRTSAQNRIKKLRREIAMWRKFAEAPAGPKAVDRAEREIAALEETIARQERYILELDAAIAEWEQQAA